MVESFLIEFKRYNSFVEKVLAQIDEPMLNRIPVKDGNSIGMIVRHLSGNITSRFTDFLSTDGEKDWRNRESEFEIRSYALAEASGMWETAWTLLESTLTELSDADLNKTITIRRQPLTVRAALLRSLAHFGYHAGQMVVLARIERESEWDWITIPRGQSRPYNADPTMEKGFS